MDNLKWYWVYVPYLDSPEQQQESALKAGYNKVCFKDEADKAIAQLKDKCQMHDFFWDGCGFAKRGFKNTIAVSEAFDNLESENRKLKRALWLARAERAHAEWAHWAAIWFCNPNAILYINKSSVSQNPDRYTIQRGAVIWRNMWDEVERKCRSKAEEYNGNH